MRKKTINFELKKLTCTPHGSVLYMCFGHQNGTGCHAMYEWARLSEKCLDTLMTRNVELFTYALLVLFYASSIWQCFQKLMMDHESEKDIRTYKDFARHLLIFLALYQASKSAHLPLTFKTFTSQHHLCAITRFNMLTLIKAGTSLSFMWHLCTSFWVRQRLLFKTHFSGHAQWISYFKIW